MVKKSIPSEKQIENLDWKALELQRKFCKQMQLVHQHWFLRLAHAFRRFLIELKLFFRNYANTSDSRRLKVYIINKNNKLKNSI